MNSSSPAVLKTNEYFIGQKVRFSMLPASAPRAFDTDCTTTGIIFSSLASERGYAKTSRDLERFKIGMFTSDDELEISVTISWIHQSEILEILDENLHNGQDLMQAYFLRCMDSEYKRHNIGLVDETD